MPKTLPNTYANGYILAGASLTALNPVTVTGSIDLGTAVTAALYAQGPGAWTITNQGSITGDSLAAIELAAGGTVTNSGFLGGHFGVNILGNPGSVTNSGTIFAIDPGASQSADQAVGVQLAAGGGVFNEVNSQITGQDAGVDISGGTGSVVNDGTINGYVYGGIYLAGGTVTNMSGAVVTGGSFGAGGAIANYGWGIVIQNGGSLSNAGTITGIGEGGAYLNGGMVTNQGLVSGAWGIAISGGIGTVINSGVLNGTSQSGIFLSGGSVGNAPGGTITGLSGVLIKGAAGTVTNSGSIGATSPAGYGVSFARGFTNLLVADPGATFTGLVDGGNVVGASVVSTLELGAAATQGTVSGIGTQFINFAQATLDPGASWSFTGSNSVVAGSTLENSGTLALNGDLQLDGMLDSGPDQPALLVLGQAAGRGRLVVENQGTVLADGPASDSTGIDIGESVGGAGDVLVTGVNSLLGNEGEFLVGDAGLGSLEIEAGGAVTTIPNASLGGLVVADAASASGSAVDVSGAGSTLDVTGALTLGGAGYGSLSVSEGGAVTAGSIDEASAAGGDGVITVAGTGSALTLTGSLTVGDQAAGEVSILNGATVSALDVTIGNASALSSGNVDVEGLGSELFVGTGGVLNVGVAGGGSGELTIGPGTTLHSNAGVVESGHASYNNNGGAVDPPFVDITTPANAGLGSNLYDLYVENIDAVQIVSGTGTWDTPMMLTGTSVADAQNNINVNGDTGEWQLSSGGTLIVNANTVDSGQAIVFEDATDTLTIGQIVNNGSAGVSGTPPVVEPGAENVLQAGGFAAEIWGYVAGDQITFNNMTASSATVVNGNTVDLFGPGNVSLGSLAFFTKTGSKASDSGAAAAALQMPVQCFAAGMRIETVDGLVRVEDLRVGDRVATADGGNEPIVWIGQRSVNCRAHPRPETVWPVRVQAGAFGDTIPARDLYLSPDHAVFVNGVLVPVKLLINGTSIVQVKRDRITYYHAELRRHAVILAEGLAVESYLDIGGRSDFGQDRIMRLHPDFGARLRSDTAMVWETRGAAPLMVTGEALEAARRVVNENTSRRRSRPAPRASQAG